MAASLNFIGTAFARHAYETIPESEEAAAQVTPATQKVRASKSVLQSKREKTVSAVSPVIASPPPLPDPASIDPREALKLGQKLMDSGRLSESLPFFSRGLAYAPNACQIYSTRGNVYDLLGKYDDSVADFDRSLQIHADVQTLRDKAEALADAGKLKDAVAICESLLVKNSNDISTIEVKAHILSQFQDLNGAISVITAAINRNSKNASLFNLRGRVYFENQHYDEALSDFKKAVQIGGATSKTLTEIAECEREMKRSEQGIADASAALRLDKNYANAYLVRAQCNRDLKKYELCMQDLDQALRINPFDAEALQLKGDNYEMAGKYNQALPLLQKAVQLSPRTRGSVILAETYRQIGDKAKGYEVINAAIQLSPRVALFHFALAYFENLDGLFTKALSDANTALKLAPYKANYYLERVTAFIGLKRPDDALVDLKHMQSLQHDHDDDVSRLTKTATALVLLKQNDRALATLSQALQTFPQEAALYAARGRFYKDTKNDNLAIADFQKAASLLPNKSYYRCQIGNMYRSAKQYDKAIAQYKLACVAEPDSDDGPIGLARVYRDMKNYHEAFNLCVKAQALNAKDSYVYEVKANVLKNLGDHKSQLQALTEGLKLSPNDADLFLDRSICQLKNGHWADAFQDANNGVSKGPSGDAYLVRSVVETALGQSKNAAEDAAYACSSACPSPDREMNAYGQIIAAINYNQLKQQDKAMAMLAIAPVKTAWPYPIIEWLQGKYGVNELMAKADDLDKKTELYTYLALKESADGDETKAKEHFNWVIKNGVKGFQEYGVAFARLHHAPDEARNSMKNLTRTSPGSEGNFH